MAFICQFLESFSFFLSKNYANQIATVVCPFEISDLLALIIIYSMMKILQIMIIHTIKYFPVNQRALRKTLF